MTNEDILELPKFSRAAEFNSQTFNADKNTVDVVFTTGATVARRTWSSRYNEELVVTPESVRLGRLNDGAPFLDTHDDYSVGSMLGVVVPGSARIEGGKGLATVKLSRRPDAAGAVQDIRDGVLRNISVGYRYHAVDRTEATATAPEHWRVTDWEPLEISAVLVPADAGAQIRSARAGELFPAIVTRKESQSLPNGAIGGNVSPSASGNTGATDMQEDQLRAQPEKLTGQAETVTLDLTIEPRAATEEIRSAIREDRERQGAIRALGKRFNQVDFAEDHAGRDTTVEAFRGILLDKIAETGSERIIPHVTVGIEDGERRAKAIEAALLHRYDAIAYPLDEAARQFRGMTMLEMGRDLIGPRTRGMGKTDLAAEMLTRAGGLMATSDFPSILANVANKTLRAAYQAAPQTFRPIVRVTTLPDFKPVSRTQLSEAPAFKKVNEHGEFTRGAMSDAKEVYSLATFGRVVGITRQTLINDDMDAFSRIPAAFGVSAANLESDLVWSKILANGTMGDGHALFDLTYHANINSSGAISVTTVGAGRAQMSKQTGLDGVTILNIDPVYLVVPKALQTVAEQFVGTTLVPALTSSVVPDSLRRLIVISEPRLDNGVTDPSNATAYSGSASHWYLMASPAQVDMIELAYLEGQQGVFTETRMGFDVDGMEIKVRLDAAAKVIDWRGFNQNAN